MFTYFPNKVGTIITPMIGFPSTINSFTGITMNAAGKSVSFIGRVFIEGGSGSKTISAAGGGKIMWATSSASTFSNAGTTMRVGLQDYDAATGFEDTNWDVYKDLIGGTDTIGTNSVLTTTMASGTKTLTHGDLVVIVIEMTTRGGADSVLVNSGNDQSWFPYAAFDTGSGPTKSASAPCANIIFDDGSYGWFPGFMGATLTDLSFKSDDTPDEVALIFQLPFAAELTEMFAQVAGIASTDNYEIILYSTPLGTPSAVYTEAFTGIRVGSTGASTDKPVRSLLTTPYTLLANTDYAIAVRPTTTNPIIVKYLTLGSAGARAMTMLGANWSYGTRTNQSGAFSQTTTRLPYFGFSFRSIENVSGGGSYAFT